MGLLIVDKSQSKAYKGQQLLDIDQNEFDILWVLSPRPERIFSEEDNALELEEEYADFKGFSILKIINDLQQKLSYRNIRLVNKGGFKIEFGRVF